RADLLNLTVLAQAQQGKYEAAQAIAIEALRIRQEILGESHPDYAASLNNLARLYQDMGDYARAEPLLRQAVEIRKKALGESHPDYAASLNDLATLYLAMSDHARASLLLAESLRIIEPFLRDTATVLGERQRLRF